MRFIVSAPLAQRFFALGTAASTLGICLVVGTATSAMAQAGGGAVYAVTYLDVSTDWVLQGAGLIKQYRDTGRREAGNLEFTVLQETTRPNRFAIVEGWRDQKSMDAMQRARTPSASISHSKRSETVHPMRMSLRASQ
jgi:quinol monooxygenase YgiN